MNTDFRSLEKRYGAPLAMKIFEEIAYAEQEKLSFYKIPALETCAKSFKRVSYAELLESAKKYKAA